MERNIYKIGKELFIISNEEIKEGDWIYKKDHSHTAIFNVHCENLRYKYTEIKKPLRRVVFIKNTKTKLVFIPEYFSC